METLLWILQGLLAAVFLITGLTKLTQSRARMAAGPMEWAADVTDEQFRAIGAAEVLGAVGLILPEPLDVAPMLTPIAAVGLAATMVVAAVTHARRGEWSRVVAPLVLLALALLVAVGRVGPYSL
jgi:uncharacterized membrane protein YphA (DoxX/SURF4 family)